jgi:hypothetical protein
MPITRCPALVLVLGLAACAPSLTRESEPYEAPRVSRPFALAVSFGPSISPLLRQRLAEALARDPDVASVNTSGLTWTGERVVRIDITGRSASLGTNFLVSFPGFLGFAPLWHRFQWIYRVRTWVELERPGERPLTLHHDEKFVVADTTPGQGLGSELGFFGYGLPGVGAGIITATAPAIQSRFEERLGPDAGEPWAQDTVALIHQALVADEARTSLR